MIRINSHPSMSTAFNPGHNATNPKDKNMQGLAVFLAVMLQSHLNVIYIKFYVYLFVL